MLRMSGRAQLFSAGSGGKVLGGARRDLSGLFPSCQAHVSSAPILSGRKTKPHMLEKFLGEGENRALALIFSRAGSAELERRGCQEMREAVTETASSVDGQLIAGAARAAGTGGSL